MTHYCKQKTNSCLNLLNFIPLSWVIDKFKQFAYSCSFSVSSALSENFRKMSWSTQSAVLFSAQVTQLSFNQERFVKRLFSQCPLHKKYHHGISITIPVIKINKYFHIKHIKYYIYACYKWMLNQKLTRETTKRYLYYLSCATYGFNT